MTLKAKSYKLKANFMITKSAKKANRQNIKRRAANYAKKEELRKLIKDFKKMISSGKIEDAKKKLPEIYKGLDKTAKTNAISKNRASRLKSRLTAQLNKKTK